MPSGWPAIVDFEKVKVRCKGVVVVLLCTIRSFELKMN